MEDKEAFQPVTEVIETQLIIRNSTRKLWNIRALFDNRRRRVSYQTSLLPA
jgi:hypothetical protein